MDHKKPIYHFGNNLGRRAFYFLFCMFFLFSCDPKERISFYDEEAQLILDYLKTNPDKYSSFLSICEEGGIATSLRAFNPYGNKYTMFLPDNDAVNTFLSSSGQYASLNELLADKDFVRTFCRYHLVNSAYRSNDFPLGALKDTTATGDFISVSYQPRNDNSGTDIFLNNEAKILVADIETVNGIIHTIDKPLTPVTFSSFDWLKRNPGFSIMTEAFEKTGLADTMGLFRKDRNGNTIRNYYTLLVEHDSILNKRGINSFDDLYARFGSSGVPLTSPNNNIYQFAAYHILEGNYFLDGLATGIYNTYASFPMSINVSTLITINRGFKVIDTIITDIDTTILNYVPVNLSISNNPSKNGPVHMVSEIIELYKPPTGTITYNFLDEPVIAEARSTKITHLFDDPSKMLKFNWSGTKYLTYENGTGESAEANGQDYLYLNGPFSVTYEIPKTPSGTYNLMIRAHSKITKKATIQVFLDGKRIGSSINLNRSATSTWISYRAGTIDLPTYDTHLLTIEAIVPGQFAWDYVQFQPVEQ